MCQKWYKVPLTGKTSKQVLEFFRELYLSGARLLVRKQDQQRRETSFSKTLIINNLVDGCTGENKTNSGGIKVLMNF